MKNKVFKILLFIIIALGILTIKSNATYVSNDATVDSGADITITVKSSENLQNYDLALVSYAGLSYNGCSANDNAAVNSSTGQISFATVGSGVTTLGTYYFKAPEVTSTNTYKVVFNINGTSNTSTVTVKAKENVPTPEPEPEPEPTPTPTPDPTPTPEPEQEKEPSFRSTNQTVYATGDINLRSSWSTSSSATRVSKDTEMTLTGTSSEKINGYIWYRVSYNGQTKYVASSLVTTTKPEDEDEKTNANLKSLEVGGFSISPSFSASTLEYTMQVEMDTEKLKVNAQAESEKATVKIEGNETIVEGENIVKVIVTAEDGTTTKTYTIKVTKQEKVFGLKSLNIKDTDISDMFKTDVYEYSINIKNIDQLDIEAIATEEDATIEILGNENLQEGENIITIIVTSKDEKNTITYQIKATKLLVIEQQTEAKTIDKMSIIYAVVGGLALIALVIVVIYTIKHRKQNMYYNNEDDFDYYPEDSEEKDEYYPEDLPEKKVKQDVDIQEENEELNVEKSKRNDKANYFLEDPEEWGEYKNKNRRGKHF